MFVTGRAEWLTHVFGIMGELPALAALNDPHSVALQQVVFVAAANHLVARPPCGRGVGAEVSTIVGVIAAQGIPPSWRGCSTPRRITGYSDYLHVEKAARAGLVPIPYVWIYPLKPGSSTLSMDDGCRRGAVPDAGGPASPSSHLNSRRRRGAPSMRLCRLLVVVAALNRPRLEPHSHHGPWSMEGKPTLQPSSDSILPNGT